jgi:putative transposase
MPPKHSPHTHSRVFYHFIWSTWDREPLLVGEIEERAYDLIRQQCHMLRCPLAALGGIENHVHLLVSLPSTLCRAEFVKSVKGVTSHKLNEAYGSPTWAFKWQGRYGVDTVSRSHVDRVKRYIENQKQHHADSTIWPSCEQDDGG